MFGSGNMNLDRFIVSSTGKGDGTDKVTWKEFGQYSKDNNSNYISVAISSPLEVGILKSEIDAVLQEQEEFKFP